MATIHRTVSVASLSSITSQGSTTKKHKTKSTSVTTGFKYHWFETTLNFIKDDRRLSLNYGVTPAQAIFIRDVLNFEVNPSLKLEKYNPLYEALKIFGLKYNFKLSRVNKDVMVLQKIPKPQKQFLEPDSTTKILTPKQEREKKVIDRISHEYMVEKAQTILDFIDDPTRATLEFTHVKPLESMFLQTVMTAARPLFPEHAQMLDHVRELKPTLDFSLQVSVGKVNKKTNERTVTFKKDPKFSKKGKRVRENSLNRSNISLNNNFVPSNEDQPKFPTNNKENSSQNSMQIDQNLSQIGQKSPQSISISVQNVQNSMPDVQNPMLNVQYVVQNVQNPIVNNSMQNVHNSMLSAQTVQNSMQTAQNSMQTAQTSMQTVQNSMQSVKNSMQTVQNSMQVVQTSQKPMDVDSPRSVGSANSDSAISVRSEPVRADRTCSASAMGVETSGSDKPLSGSYGSQNNINVPISTNLQHVSRRVVTGLNPRKAKLLEAMSMPVQLDKPARMMQKMGWDGGPLGIRGIGITEPIIPALDLVSGAGLGHVEPAKPAMVQRKVDVVQHKVDVAQQKVDVTQKKVDVAQQKVGRRNFRQEVLGTILDLVQTEKVVANLVYPVMRSKKEINFVRRVVTSFSERKKISVKGDEEARVAKLVIDILSKLPNVVIHGTASECKTQITLRKVIIVRPQMNLPLLLPQTGVIKVEHLLALADTVGKYVNKNQKQKRYLGVRITILIEILHFLQFNDQFKEVIFETALSNQETVYITKAVQSLNRKRKPPMCPIMSLEEDICQNIFQVIGNNMLKVHIDMNQLCVLFEKNLVMELKTYKSSLLNELHSINNMNTVQSINEIRPNDWAQMNFAKNLPINAQGITNNSITSVNNSNNIIVPVLNNFNNNKPLHGNDNVVDKKVDTSKSRVSQNTSDAKIKKKGSEYMNKILAERLANLDEYETDTERNALLKDNKEITSEDDDVVLIETEREIILISDDESDYTRNTQNTDKSVKLDEVLGKQRLEIKISNVEVDLAKISDSQENEKHRDGNITQRSEDMNVSNSQRSGEIDRTQFSADMVISNSQDSTFILETSNISASSEKDVAKCATTNVVDNHNNSVCDLPKIQGSENIVLTKDNEDTSLSNIHDSTKLDVSNIAENAKMDETQGITRKGLSIIQDNTKLDAVENAKIDLPNRNTNISISNVNNSSLDVSIVNIVNIEKTDIDKVIVKTEQPKVEKLSYSEEFDKDLHDLEQVLLLDDDDDVFDYTLVKKEKDDSIDKIERPSSKRSRSDSVESSPDNSKKTKIFTFKNSKNLLIVPKDYPNVQITKECMMKIQTILSEAIEKCKELPLLKCHGIQDGGLVYSCHNEQSLFFVENSLSVASDYEIISDVTIEKKSYIMKIRFNSLLDNIKILLSRLELYNAGLITDSWCVKELQKCEDHIIIFVEIDEYSYKYICDNSFSLYAGIDEARFSVVWD